MIYIEAPNEFVYKNYDVDVYSFFLAGGISNCPDWQKDVVNLLSDENLIILNPRRSNYDFKDSSLAEEQIKWEWYHLDLADHIPFWFPAASLCPIALYELGTHTPNYKIPVIGIEPGYAREEDIRIQTQLVDTSIPITNSFEEFVEHIIKAAWVR